VKLLSILFALLCMATVAMADTVVVGVDENGQLEKVIVIRGKTFDKAIPTDAPKEALANVKTIELLASDGTVIGKTIAPEKSFIYTDDFANPKEPKGTVKEDKSFAAILPWTDTASSVRIKSGKNPDSVLKIDAGKTEYRQVEVQPTRGAGGGYGTLDLLFLGARYQGKTGAFNTKADNLKSYLKNHYNGYNKYTAFHKYNPNSNLGCGSSGTNCSKTEVLAAAEQSGLNYDEIQVLVKSATCYGYSLPAFYDYKTTPWVSPSFVNTECTTGNWKASGFHELGHSWGELADEYLYTSNLEDPGKDYVNCRFSNNLCPGLESLYVNTGCSYCYTQCKRPENNIMKSLGYEFYSTLAITAEGCYPDGLDKRMAWFRTH